MSINQQKMHVYIYEIDKIFLDKSYPRQQTENPINQNIISCEKRYYGLSSPSGVLYLVANLLKVLAFCSSKRKGVDFS